MAGDALTEQDWEVKPYLITTGTLFGLVAVAHVARTMAEWPRLGTDPWFILEGPGLGVLAGAIGIWAWRLLAAFSRERH
jgi:hypothetical protein